LILDQSTLTPLVSIRPARAEDLPRVCALLTAAQLPLDGLEEQFGDGYAVAEANGSIVGAEGIETYEEAGLLRSAVVDPSWRGRGVGDALTRDRLAWAKARGLREVYLLTTTAADYFPRYGFVRVSRTSAPTALQRSREFAEACPQTAVTMRLLLADQAS
jgi:amino-acid N-acetyltransferase